MSTTAILAVIGGTTLILTAAARVPAALAEFLRACILVANAARELRTAVTKRAPADLRSSPLSDARTRRPGLPLRVRMSAAAL